jgi:hypothetical protein
MLLHIVPKNFMISLDHLDEFLQPGFSFLIGQPTGFLS